MNQKHKKSQHSMSDHHNNKRQTSRFTVTDLINSWKVCILRCGQIDRI